jgi:hypothetical protein
MGARVRARVIDGRRYDPCTAQFIHGATFLHRGDYRWYNEDLYRTKNGKFFLDGEGGALSRWGKNDGSGYSSGEGIKPLTDEEAREWCERQGVETIEKYFVVQDA